MSGLHVILNLMRDSTRFSGQTRVLHTALVYVCRHEYYIQRLCMCMHEVSLIRDYTSSEGLTRGLALNSVDVISKVLNARLWEASIHERKPLV